MKYHFTKLASSRWNPTWSSYFTWPTVSEWTRLKSTESECFLVKWTLSCAQGILSECGMDKGCGITVPSDWAICQRSGSNQLDGFQCLNLISVGCWQASCVSEISVRSSRTSSPVWGMTSSLQATLPFTKTDITTSSGKIALERQQGSRPPSQLFRFCQSVSKGFHSLIRASVLW